MLYFATGSPTAVISEPQTRTLLEGMLSRLGPVRRVLLLPPDITRRPSGAGRITAWLYQMLTQRGAHVEVLPALGTHAPMTPTELHDMFPGIPLDAFHAHRWRTDLHRLGEVPAELVRQVSAGRVDCAIPCDVNELLVAGWDRIISIGQLVPHEVAGIANYNKNVFIGAGGQETINRTHFLGAVCGLEQALGRVSSPVRTILDHMSAHLARDLPLSYLLTVRGHDDRGMLVTRGLFAGDDDACFRAGARLCQQVTITLLREPVPRAVVYLAPDEYKSTWLGNKAIYRLRMALADDGELIILAPGVHTFGEDPQIDRLIRTYGYRGTPQTLQAVQQRAELAANLAAAAHLIHGSCEGRFRITYCPGHLSRAEVEGVGFDYAPLPGMLAKYDPRRLRAGPNALPGGEPVFYVSNPALGLWALKSQFEDHDACPPTC